MSKKQRRRASKSRAESKVMGKLRVACGQLLLQAEVKYTWMWKRARAWKLLAKRYRSKWLEAKFVLNEASQMQCTLEREGYLPCGQSAYRCGPCAARRILYP